MTDAIYNFYNFKTLHLNDKISETDKEKINDIISKISRYEERKNKLIEEKEKLQAILETEPNVMFKVNNSDTFRKKIALDIYCDIGNKEKMEDLLCFKNDEDKITFKNDWGYICKVDSIFNIESDLFVNVQMTKGSLFKVSLNRFLQLFEIGDFKLNTSNEAGKKFSIYLSSISSLLTKIDRNIFNISKELDEIVNSDFYKNMEKEFAAAEKDVLEKYKEERSQYNRKIIPEPAKRKIKKLKEKEQYLATIWNTTINDKDKAYIIGWLLANIRKIVVKVVDRGVSDKIMSNYYPESIYGKYYKEKANTSGWDAVSGKLYLKKDYAENISSRAIEILEKMTNNTNLVKNIKKNYISSTSLTLFLLKNYNSYGIQCGELLEDIPMRYTAKNIMLTEFKKFEDDFNCGYYDNIDI